MTAQETQPELLAILVCDDVIRDVRTHKFSLIGLFNRISARRFPSRHARLHVFVSLTNGHGTCEAELRCVLRDEDQPVGGMKGKIEFPGPLAVVDMNFDIANLTFPKPGRYSFDFYCSGVLLGSRPFDVVPEGAKLNRPA